MNKLKAIFVTISLLITSCAIDEDEKKIEGYIMHENLLNLGFMAV